MELVALGVQQGMPQKTVPRDKAIALTGKGAKALDLSIPLINLN